MASYATGKRGLGTGAMWGFGLATVFFIVALALQLTKPKMQVGSTTVVPPESGVRKGFRIASWVLFALFFLFGLLSIFGVFGQARTAAYSRGLPRYY